MFVFQVASPASVSSNYLNKSIASVEPPMSQAPKSPDANALVLNLVLSDSLLNLYRDHNFDSCTMCVCSNECNIRGRDGAVYLPDQNIEDGDINCMCGFSAVINRKLAHQSGLFYEDETEATGITEDLYYRKKPSLLPPQHDSKPNDNLAEKSNIVDGVPQQLLELVQQQSTHNLTAHNSLVKYSKQYLKSAAHQTTAISMVELMDSNEVVFVALEQVKNVGCSESAKVDEALKGTCMHKWTLLQAIGPYCSEDIIRVMKALQPVLNEAVHIKKSSKDTSVLSVQGPLTWRQFHQMAGPSTKGNTDDQCEPLPVPTVTVGHEKDFMTLSPLALHYWDSLSIEPFSQPRDIAYIVVAPDNELLLDYSKRFFKNLSVTYEVIIISSLN